MHRISLPHVIERLEAAFGRPEPPQATDPWLMILWENVAYLADDKRKQEAFSELQERVGTRPEQIIEAPRPVLRSIAVRGIMADERIDTLRRCAKIALEDFAGDLRPALKWPLPKAKQAFKKFPGIGAPGAEKILLFTRSHPLFALESNGLRALVRLGFGREAKSYSTTYRLVQQDARPELKTDYAWLIAAHQLLRLHGQTLCRRTEPLCKQCPLAQECPFYQTSAQNACPDPR